MAKSLKDTNHYDLLGIQRSATDQAIQRSYYKLSRAFHPDSVAGTPLQQMRKELDIIFAKISEANTVLTNPTKREEYDQLLDNPDLAQLNDQAQQAAQAEVFYTKGNVYLKTRNYQAAEEQLKWACDLLPNEGEYHLDYAWAIFKNPDNDPKESIEKANKHLKIAMEKGANYIKSLYYKGSIEKAENTPKLALKTFEELLKRQPHHTEAAREARYLKIQLNKAKGKSNKKSGLLGGLFKK